MNWNTIYITGKSGFWADVNDRLSGADVMHMVGSLEHLPEDVCRGVYWLADNETLEDFKYAIGAKLIWRYRLRFTNDAEAEISTVRKRAPERFTERERKLIQKMRLKTRKRTTA